MKIHCFKESLNYSHSCEDRTYWRHCYEQFFPGFVAMLNHRADGWQQRAGIDRSVIMPDSRRFLIDEKARRKDYGDILLEEYSDKERHVYGWACKPLRADYIAYAIEETGRCYLLPVMQLQSAFRRNYEQWTKWRPIEARNQDPGTGRTWTSVNWAVPVNTLFSEIGKCLRAQFDPVT